MGRYAGTQENSTLTDPKLHQLLLDNPIIERMAMNRLHGGRAGWAGERSAEGLAGRQQIEHTNPVPHNGTKPRESGGGCSKDGQCLLVHKSALLVGKQRATAGYQSPVRPSQATSKLPRGTSAWCDSLDDVQVDAQGSSDLGGGRDGEAGERAVWWVAACAWQHYARIVMMAT